MTVLSLTLEIIKLIETGQLSPVEAQLMVDEAKAGNYTRFEAIEQQIEAQKAAADLTVFEAVADRAWDDWQDGDNE